MQTLIDAMPDFVCFKDGDGHWLKANDASIRVFQLQDIDYRGKKDSELAKLNSKLRGSFLTCKETDAKVWKEGVLIHAEETVSDADGSVRVYDVAKVPVSHPDGEKKGLVIIGHDITERKQAVEAIQKSEEKYRLLAENTMDCIWKMDKDLKFIYVNPSIFTMLGFTPEEWIGSTIAEHCSRHEMQKIMDMIENEFRKNEKYTTTFEIILDHKDGRKIPVEINGKILVNKDDEIAGFQGTTRDITERKKAEDQIKNDLKEKEVLLKEVHHRVKNNMQIISSLLKMQASYIKDKEAEDLFKDSCNRVRSMALIHEKLYQSKNLAYIDFKKYMGSLIPYLFSSYGVETSAIQFDIDVNNVHLNINAAIPCGLIVNELISNSLKHAFPKGRKGIVSISMQKRKDVDDPKKQMFTFIIKDNGIGIPPGMDVKNTDSLGFKLVYALTEQLHGNIELDRRKGLTIKIQFRE